MALGISTKSLCFKYIRKFSFLSILPVISPKLKITDFRAITDQSFWQNFYHHYRKWQNFKEKPRLLLPPINDLPLDKHEVITCFDVWSDLVAYGTNHGRVYIINHPDNPPIDRIIKSGNDGKSRNDAIKQVKFWYCGNDILHLVSLSQSTLMKIWNMVDRTSNIPTRIFNVNLICVGTAHSLYVVNYDIVVKYNLDTNNHLKTASSLDLDLAPEEKVVAINSRETKIFVATRHQLEIRLFVIEDQPTTYPRESLSIKSVLKSPLLPRINLDFQTYITLNNTAIFTQHRMINTINSSTKAWIPHIISSGLDSVISCVILHANFLIIGATNGKLLFQLLESINDLSKFNFNQKPIYKFQISSKPIVGIKVVQNSRKVNIVVVSQSEIFVLEI